MFVATAFIAAALASDFLEDARGEFILDAVRERLGIGDPGPEWEPRARIFAIGISSRHEAPKVAWTNQAIEAIQSLDDVPERMRDFLCRIVRSARATGGIGDDPYGPEMHRVTRALRLSGIVPDGHVRFSPIAFSWGPWTVLFESWKQSCLERGVGRYYCEDDDDWSCPPAEDEPLEFLEQCVFESQVRIASLPESDPDGPPKGAAEWVMDLWLPGEHRGDGPTQVTLWRTAVPG
jgi:hypothetical protein